MSIETFLEKTPLPAPVKRDKKVLSVTLTEAEYDMVQRLAHHENMKLVYGGHLYQVVRHALAYFLPDVSTMVEDERWTPKVLEFKRGNEMYVLETARDAIVERLDIEAHRLNLLWDYGQCSGALTEFQRLLTDIYSLPEYWRNIVLKFRLDHAEMQRFEERVNATEYVHDMQSIWEAMPE